MSKDRSFAAGIVFGATLVLLSVMLIVACATSAGTGWPKEIAVEDGVWYEIGPLWGHSCCTCRLAHDVWVRAQCPHCGADIKRFEMTWKVNEARTEYYRRRDGIIANSHATSGVHMYGAEHR